MEVTIIVIVVFIVLLLLIAAAVRMCNKYHCIHCCDPDVESMDDLDITGDVDMSDSLDGADQDCEDILDDDLYDNMGDGEKEQRGL